MQVSVEGEMAVVLEGCLSELEDIEAQFIRECHLQQPPTPMSKFARLRQLSPKDLTALRNRATGRLKELLAAKNIRSLGDIL